MSLVSNPLRAPNWFYWAVAGVAIVISSVVTLVWLPGVEASHRQFILHRLWAAPALCVFVATAVTLARRFVG